MGKRFDYIVKFRNERRPSAMQQAAAMGAIVLGAGLVFVGCGVRPRMCSPKECARGDACVAGRCIKTGATPAVARSERYLFLPRKRTVSPFRPIDRGLVALRSGDELLLSFELSGLPKRTLVEAYVVLAIAAIELDRSGGGFAAEPLDESWTVETALWKQPHHGKSSTARTMLTSPASQLIRVDVRTFIKAEQLNPGSISGVAIQYEGASLPSVQWEELANSSWRSPQLEVYVESEKSPQRPTGSAPNGIVVKE